MYKIVFQVNKISEITHHKLECTGMTIDSVLKWIAMHRKMFQNSVLWIIHKYFFKACSGLLHGFKTLLIVFVIKE